MHRSPLFLHSDMGCAFLVVFAKKKKKRLIGELDQFIFPRILILLLWFFFFFLFPLVCFGFGHFGLGSLYFRN